MKNLYFTFCIIGSIIIASFHTSCNKDPEIITNTVTVTDTIIITQNDTVYIDILDTVILTDTINITSFIQDTATTFILVRHAEKEETGSDPGLTSEGMDRAAALSRTLQNVPLNAVFSTDFNRTKQTAEVTASDQMLSVEIYNAFSLSPLIDNVLANHFSKSVLIVGHSNTTPQLVNQLIGSNIYSNIPESEYDNLYIVSVLEKGRASIVHIKYGM